jgi:preprotein translocase subunit YajC
MLISMAHAQEVAADTAIMVGEAPSAANAFAWNIGLIVLMVVMFYILLIRPQQKRFAAHKTMLDGLKKGDAVVTAGGLVGTIDTLTSDEEVVVDLGGMKVTAVRSTIQAKTDKTPAASNDKKPTAKAAAKKAPAKKIAKKAAKK